MTVRSVLRTARGRFVKGVHAYRKPLPHWERAWLHHEYVERQRSTGEIATEIGTTDGNVIYWLRKHGIPRRSIAQARAAKHWGAFGAANPMYGRIGQQNPRYVDGSTPERQRLYVRATGRQFLREILARDEYHCRRCDAPHSGGKKLHVHHVKPWAGHPELRFDATNVVTLCDGCHWWVHSKANVNREWMA